MFNCYMFHPFLPPETPLIPRLPLLGIVGHEGTTLQVLWLTARAVGIHQGRSPPTVFSWKSWSHISHDGSISIRYIRIHMDPHFSYQHKNTPMFCNSISRPWKHHRIRRMAIEIIPETTSIFPFKSHVICFSLLVVGWKTWICIICRLLAWNIGIVWDCTDNGDELPTIKWRVSIALGVPQARWMVYFMENPTQMGWWQGVPPS